MVIDGKKIAEEILGDLKTRPRPAKFLAAVLVGDEPAMVSFVKQKEKIARVLSVDFRIRRLPENIKESDLRTEVLKVAGDKNCGGLILQLPLPENVNRGEIIKIIPPEKDIDNLSGKSSVSSPAVGVVETIIQNLKFKIQNSRVAVVGLGFLIGKPVAEWLKGKCSELYSLDSSNDLGILKQADLVISGVGKAGFIKPEILKDGATVIDFGYDFKDGKISGDFDADSTTYNLQPITYTPTPGGTGPILVAKLFENFYKLNS
ncbi:MAG: Bifunctional protein FolD [Candidatus Jorgensenbacteria bacterium GW2011_GWA1_48_13]|uniref:Bifunctional protein FolD n=2 Tax=Candidatus Joergenseniibacteriota TaxID=1752739 RepID=A0A0G1W926_9BACT|nr:MAG: Bifunctional protein FolD [Candidatus Jorgensenbacteria bacterium GW2011_GWA1_48_13]KKU99383.1 MAG: Bifunctional protein FolD [Candidatus Jorgensenbacteria bacterium GW2011_GWC1_48_8]KKW15268.1 MAG: Bifunctional protein FolD [Candidatus Jorgensenbacteria bacterium GW2011_GWB1_50_10]